ncbi:transforming growth factor-beta-induced protein ig-h3-like isoform X2 [Babylonia areolata]|uniref:transforming growth factor-beta-induced protein ig-h3-like isoform X2 n=1 Tax=Babylonia areolata TaxID=304850 RepID=UPI003FCF2E44
MVTMLVTMGGGGGGGGGCGVGMVGAASPRLPPAGNLLEEMQKAGATTAVSLLRSAGLENTVRTEFFSLFVPTDKAFQALPQEWQIHLNVNASARARILQYHAVPAIFRTQDAFNDLLLNTSLGQDVRVNVYRLGAGTPAVVTAEGGRIIRGDIQATNGYLHLVNRVLLPPVDDLYQLLVTSPELSSFKSVVDSAGMQKELAARKGTLLAPSNAAFTALVTSLGSFDYSNLMNNNELLKELVMYHLLSRVLFSAGAFNDTYPTTDMGHQLVIATGTDGTMNVQKARVTQSDVAATNGVMHVLDSVLVPPNLTPVPVGK